MRISFFADKGITEINTTLKNFVIDAKIKGSVQQEKFRRLFKVIHHNLMIRIWRIIKENFEAQKER